jgi:hypothetical protein
MTPFGKLVFSSLLLAVGVLGYVVYTAPFSGGDISASTALVASSSAATTSTTTLVSTVELTNQNASSSSSTSTIGSFSDFIKKNGEYVCSVSTRLSTPLNQGVILFNATKIRGEFPLTGGSDGSGTSTYFVLSNKTLYSWILDGNDETKSRGVVVRNSPGVSTTTDDLVTRFSFDDVTEYSCEEKNIEALSFTIPPSISFVKK